MRRRLFALPGCPYAHRALMVLREKGLPFELVLYDLTARPPELDAMGPRAKSPTLLDGDSAVYGSQVVLEYLEDRYPEPALMPSDPLARARVRMCIAHISDVLAPMLDAVMHDTFYKAEHDERAIAEKLDVVNAELSTWNDALAGRTYAVSNEFSLADVTLYTLFPALERWAKWQLPSRWPHLEAWIERIQARPSSAPVGK
jgi:glutathione S-transferase